MLLDAIRPTAWRTFANITEFQINFSFVVYNYKWQPWHAEFENFMLFHYFSIFAFMCVYIHNQQKLCLQIQNINKDNKFSN